MAKFSVYYVKPEFVRDFIFANEFTAVDLSKFAHVCDVEADSLGDVWRRMNVVDGSDIEMPIKLKVRSMMVGDLVIAEDGMHQVASVGWKRVEKAAEK